MRYSKSKMKEIAKLSRLSIATVSRTLNEETSSLVKPATREKIWGITKKLNYIPDRMAQSLRTRRNNTFGFLMNFDTDTINGYIQEILNGALTSLARAKYDLKIISSAHFESLDAVMKTHGLDGLILPHAYRNTFPNLSQESKRYRNRVWPVVIINDYNPLYYVNQFYSDNKLASSFLTSYLIEKGYKEFYFIGSEEDSPDAVARKKAFLDILKKNEIAFDKNKDSVNGHFQEKGGYDMTLAFFDTRPDFRGAIFCANDAMALGAIRALGELGLKCPQDVTIVGFDGIAMGEFSNPPITTIKFELYEMGKMAVQILENIVSGRQKTFVRQKFPFRLVERQSCKT